MTELVFLVVYLVYDFSVFKAHCCRVFQAFMFRSDSRLEGFYKTEVEGM